MPGVPSGKGCNACRKQKKKCDQEKPLCGRCNRLQIPCIGSGQQRWKFTEPQGLQVQALPPTVKKKDLVSLVKVPCPDYGMVLYEPKTEIDRLSRSFISTINLSQNLRYNLVWFGGVFLNEVPSRLGMNVALDSSIKALVSAHAGYCVNRKVTPEALTHYSRALSDLRICLDDPVKACDSSTLCAVTILIMCQGFLGYQGQRWTGHCEGAAKIIRARGYYKPKDEFEQKLLLTLRAPILFEGLLNTNIDFTQKEWEMLVDNEFMKREGDDGMMSSLVKLRGVFSRARSQSDDPETLIVEVKEVRETLNKMVKMQFARLHEFESSTTSSTRESIMMEWQDAAFQCAYGIGMVVAVICDCILSALEPKNTEVLDELEHYGKEILDLAEKASKYKPLGANYMALCLGAAWVGTSDPQMKVSIEKAWIKHGGDFAGGLDVMPVGEMEWTSRQLRLLDLD